MTLYALYRQHAFIEKLSYFRKPEVVLYNCRNTCLYLSEYICPIYADEEIKERTFQ